MAGYSRLYCIGGVTRDGINPIWCQIRVGDADRQWWEVHYIDQTITPLGDIRVIVPEGPDHPHALIDCCLAFLPDTFDGCPSMATVRAQARGSTRLDFNLEPTRIPRSWGQLREEAWETFEQLHIFRGDLHQIDLRERGSPDPAT